MESQKKGKPKGSHARRRASSSLKFDLATDLTYLLISWSTALIVLAVVAVVLLAIFLINRSVVGTVTAAGIVSLALGGLVLSKGRIAGALLLLGLGIVLIIVAGRL